MTKLLYFVAIMVPEEQARYIRQLKEGLSETYRSHHALKTPPHITLQMPMRIEGSREDDLIKAMEHVRLKSEDRDITLNGISSFPPRTIFIDVVSSLFLDELHESVKKELAKLSFIEDSIPVASFHPHVTLMTRDLSKTMYHKAWESLKDMKYNACFRAASFQLLRHDGKQWQVIRDFSLDKK